MPFRSRKPVQDAEAEEVSFSAGKITQLVQQKKNELRISVFIEGKFAFGLFQETLFKSKLSIGQVLSVEDQRQLVTLDLFPRAKFIALNFLGYRARTIKEIRDRLTEFPDPVKDAVIQFLTEYRYVDDERYAQMFAESRFRNKGYGARRIYMELVQRGIDRTLATQVTADLSETEDIAAKAQQVAEKKWHQLSSESNPQKRKQKLFAFLLRRGYQTEICKQIIDNL